MMVLVIVILAVIGAIFALGGVGGTYGKANTSKEEERKFNVSYRNFFL